MNGTRRRRTILCSAVLAAILAVPSPAHAGIARPAQAPDGPTDFSSSFEAGDPQPTWTDTVETDAHGAKKASGVIGASFIAVPGSVTDQVTALAVSGENTGGGEVRAKLIDSDVLTKWLVFAPTAFIQFTLAQPVAVQRYALSSANDAPERDPRDWTLSGSTDGQTWTPLDSRTGQVFAERYQTNTYDFKNPTAYPFYRLDITRNGGADIVQLAEVQLSDGTDRQPPPTDMKSSVGTGPAESANAMMNAGWTGAKALQYAGSVVANGRGYSYNKLFDVNVRVTKTSELSYLIFPEFTQGDRRYPSTYASVDLAFDDGTYLSESNATDQHFRTVSPQGQGDSKTLYAGQWNHQQSRIGDVAAGKTIKRILVGYDNPNGPASFKGWLDDIRIVGDPGSATKSHLSDYVLTNRGTNSTGDFSRGNNFPATAVPHGFNFWTPLTDAGSMSWLYEYQRTNNADNRPTLQAFAVSHEPSPWMGDRQTFQVMPSAAAGVPSADRTARSLAFRHENEVPRPYYYGVTFDNGVRTEIAPTDHAAMFRFTFPGNDASLVFDNVNNAGGLTLDTAAGTVTGFSDVRSGLSAGATRLFVYATFDKAVTAGGPLGGGGGPNVTGYLRFAGGPVTMRIATSLISVDQAKHNLDLEIAGTDTFDTVKDRAQRLWDNQLRVVEVEGANADQLTTLYSNLYRLFLYPNSAYENTGTLAEPLYRHASPVVPMAGANTPTQTGAQVLDGKLFANNGFWDTYRTTWPAYSLFTPTQAGEMIDGFVQQYKDGGWIARWSSPGYADLMVGTSSDVAFADAYLKGVKFDAKSAFDAALKNATVAPPNAGVGRKGLRQSEFLGYTPMGSTGEAMSWAMDGYINDFGIANMAQGLYDAAPADDPNRALYSDYRDYFRNRAQNYVNMFDPSVNFFQGRDAAGAFRLPPNMYDPRVWGFDYTETDGWNMAFHVPQDGQGLANLYGGRDRLADKLDQFFATPETAMFTGSYGGVIHEMAEARDVRMGQYGHSNQPSHHIIYMYDYAGQPWKAQQKVREALSRLYVGSEIGQGYAGDEDNGEMSAWYVFSALGFYPLQMGSPFYAVGSPLFTKATVHLENGKSLVVNAPKNSPSNVYVQGLKVNGKAYNKTFLSHDLLAKGATLDFDMGPQPSRWGSAADAAPPSITQGPRVPQPLRDLTGPGRGTATGTPGMDVNRLFDNTSQTRTLFGTANPFAQYHLNGPVTDRATYYTLTSGPTPGIPGGVSDQVVEVTASGENTGGGEVKENLVDGDVGTKWLVFNPTGSVTFKLAQPIAVSRYALTSANDAPGRDPQDWTLEGSADGTTWSTLDSQSGQTFGDRFQTKEYGFTNTTAYLYYRLTITRNNGSGLLQLAEVQLSTGAAGGTVGDPKSWLLKGSYDGRHWTVIDQRTNEMFRWRSQTRVFKVANPGRFAYYELDVTDNGGAQSTALSEVEFLATPRPVCDKVISGEQGGPLTVNAGVTCIDGGTVHGPVTVRPGASLYAIGGKIDGPVSASGATAVVLAGTVVGGPVSITGTTGEASVETAQIAGPVSLVNNKGPLVSASTVGGPLSCTGNNPVPLDNGLDNTIGGPAAGQCAGM